jgi:hypothetical protein
VTFADTKVLLDMAEAKVAAIQAEDPGKKAWALEAE